MALKRIDAGGWTGTAHDAWRSEHDSHAQDYVTTGDGMAAAPTVIEQFAHCLVWAQGQAAEAIARYNQGQQATAQGRSTDPGSLIDPGDADRAAARDQLNRARQQVQDVGDDAAGTLNDLAGGAPQPGESTAAQIGHGAMDLAGFVPVVGDMVDLLNANWYKSEGRTTDAALSAAAAIPFAGWGAGVSEVAKWGSKGAEAGEEGAEAVTKSARSQIAARNLARSLASESQVSEQGVAIAGPGMKHEVRAADRLADTYGGNTRDWVKMSSHHRQGPDGVNFETHWYQNTQTGERVEFKTKFDVEGKNKGR